MTGTNGIAQRWIAHLQLDCPVPDGSLGGGCRPGPAGPGATPAQRAAEATDDLERVAVLSSN